MAKRFKLKAIITVLAVILCVAAAVLCVIFADNTFFNIKNTAPESGSDFVRFIDVGQGDSILIHSNGYSALIDTGPEDSALELSESLHSEGIEIIDVLIFTHLHTDHTGGVEQILKDFKVENLILPELSTFSDGIYSAELAIDKMTRSGGQIYKAVKDMHFEIGDFKVTVIGAYYDILEENNRSLIIKAEAKGKSFLFMGDAEGKTERKLIEDNADIRCDVLKVGHHGSSTSTTSKFLEKAKPSFAAITVGEGNMYNHPHLSTLKILEMNSVKIYRTDYSGDITFFAEKGKLRVETEK